MRLLLIGIYAFSFFVTSHEIYQTTNLEDFVTDIETLSHYFSEEDLSIDSFEITIRGKMDQSQIEQLENILAQKDFSKDTQKKKQVTEEFNVTDIDQREEVQVSYVLSGNAWNEEVKQIVLEQITHKEFTNLFETGFFYSCFQSTNSANISSNLIFDRIQDDFEIDNQNEMNETDFKVIGGKTDHLKSTLSDNEDSINIQLSLREEVEGTTLTIGTPILVIEY